MKYTKEILDGALLKLQNADIKVRKSAATLFLRAACAELGTKNTKPVKEWFVLNIKEYISAIRTETDAEILWRIIYTLQNFCARYILLAHLFKIDSDIITENSVKNAENTAKEYVAGILENQKHPKILQAVASFFWVYKKPFVWDIFIEVLKKKQDKLTLSHAKIAIGQCYEISKNDKRLYILDMQIKKLVEILAEKNILQTEMKLLKELLDIKI